jgi:predicted ester cyclase
MGNRHDLGVADGLFAPDFRIAPSAPPGPEGVKDFIRRLLAAFPDLRVEVHELVPDGDRVAAHLTLAGTHRGEWAGVAATGRPVAIREMHIYRVERGRLVERWVEVDRLGMVQQLGLLPTTPTDTAS